MKELHLQPRLQMLADLVPPAAALADVGTDHGYLPVYLLQKGAICQAIASDIGAEPLDHARRTAEEYGVSLELRLCDGLQGIAPEEVDTVVIAGVGGESIITILSAAPWTKNGCRLILQPMTRQELLRRWLAENGYRFTAERLVEDKGTIYPILCVEGGAQPPLSEAETYSGLLLADDPLYGEYLTRQMARLKNAADGMRRSQQNSCKADSLDSLYDALAEKRRQL
ncbi:MAG: SAM-dependent methyltransferase [Oscillospiraceae bacterium]|nr:SAM-dependent methyltransferase [Oscillospiraceae bacterium]